jgi:hypothetical protein
MIGNGYVIDKGVSYHISSVDGFSMIFVCAIQILNGWSIP